MVRLLQPDRMRVELSEEFQFVPERSTDATTDVDPVRRGLIGAIWRLARRSAGLPQVSMHDLRHLYANALIRAGLSVKVVNERLEHSGATMTLNVYSQLWPDDEDRTRQAIDDVFAAPVCSVCAPPSDLEQGTAGQQPCLR